ncbi:methylated-DNA--[protein]-cysteine S-methyltransferase [Psychrobacillus lasiicapitis]|uniref:methylated-DNA--[protein]-cysteine S-methyltransferase n=1 Tax=Psychrobacillus lasiicapitis TaxID=1636719 RepID=A0A544T512_9BACI|nr:methylated-DNA--[protein]-cysteine S-methyltransferase [Psychrobacillus lasiicapitis]TQR12542.1 methylated-DNA--[protein]-cysteine S-methyltransferase [Psychrobacillus lasiicapitis]GGA38976.1 methylated-DNA--protein-cysteine methyltransferase, inducible [Psychrobacillus lasiicapitis]
MNKIYWTRFIHNEWRLYIAATENGLSYIGSQGKPYEEMEAWLAKRFPKYELVEDEKVLTPYMNELKEYLDGSRREFAMPVDLKGTAFQLAIWDALTKIPYGEKKSYSQIANLINNPTAVRAVGAAIGANPILITIPCHRVVAKSGALTGYRGGLEMKEKLLTLEMGER